MGFGVWGFRGLGFRGTKNKEAKGHHGRPRHEPLPGLVWNAHGLSRVDPLHLAWTFFGDQITTPSIRAKGLGFRV